MQKWIAFYTFMKLNSRVSGVRTLGRDGTSAEPEFLGRPQPRTPRASAFFPLVSLRAKFRILLIAGLLGMLKVAAAATYSLTGSLGSGVFSSCSFFTGTTWRCTNNVDFGNDNSVVLNITTPMTLLINGNFSAKNGLTINNGGNAFTIQTAGNFKVDNNLGGSFNIVAGGNIDIGNNGDVTGNLSAGGNISLGSGTGILGACSPSVAACTGSVSISAASLVEGNAGQSNLVFTLTRSAAGSAAATVSYTTTAGTATAGASCVAGIDYRSSSGTATIAAGALTTTVAVPVCGDSSYEGDESLTVTLSNPVNVGIGTASAIGTILNDDAPPLVAEYRFDEAVWNGTAGQVVDSSGNGYHATASGALSGGGSPGPAYSAAGFGTCNFGVFDGGAVSKSFVQMPGSFPGLSGSFSLTAWINSSNATAQHQRIFVRDDNDNGWALSLADGTGTGVLRFFNRNVNFNSPTGGVVSAGGVAIDTAFQLSSNTWYFVALTVDTVGKTVVIYVYDGAGVQRSKMSASFTGTWGAGTGATAIGGETAASAEGNQASWHFLGRIDEVQVYSGALTQTLVQSLLTRTRTCSSVHHYAISYPLGNPGVTCEALAVRVTGHDASDAAAVPAGGTQITLTTLPASGGWALKSGAGTFTAPNRYTFSGSESLVEFWLTQTSPTTAPHIDIDVSDGSLTDSNASEDAGAQFVDSAFKYYACSGAVPGTCAAASINPQRAGLASNVAPAAQNLYLRALKSGSTTGVCVAALTGPQSVEMAYECDNPATCSAANLLSVNGGSPTTVSRNGDGAVSASAGAFVNVPLTFDGNGFAPFNINFSDVGQITLHSRKTVAAGIGSPPSTAALIYGASNSFVVAPYDFLLTPLGPYVAGEPFSVKATARTAAATVAPNFGLEATAESVILKAVSAAAASANNSQLTGPVGGAAGTLSAGAFTLGKCAPASAGSVCDGALAWSEVGDLTLSVARASGTYLNSGLAAWGSALAGPFKPAFLKTEFDTTQGCGAFTYSGQPFRLKVTAMSKANPVLGSADAATLNYTGAYARAVAIGADAASGCTPTSAGFTNATLAASGFASGGAASTPPVSNTLAPLPVTYTQALASPSVVAICARDADGVNSHGQTQASLRVRNGRLKVSNAFGSEKSDRNLPVQAQYWSGGSWILASDDTCTGPLLTAAAPAVALSGYTGSLSAANMGSSHVSIAANGAGKWNLILTKPSPPAAGSVNLATGSVNLAINLGSTTGDTSCLFKPPATPPATTGAALSWFRAQYGSTYPDGSACPATGRDPSARATFGIYSPETRKSIHVRELY